MKLHTAFCLAVVATGLTSCSLVDRYGTSRPQLTLVSEEQSSYSGRNYVTRRFFVNGNPNETFVESIELAQGLTRVSTVVDRSAGRYSNPPMVSNPYFLE